MRRVAIVNSEGLLGQELKEALARRGDLCADLKLIAADSEASGMITRGLDGAALVQSATGDSLRGVDLVFVCPGPGSVSLPPVDAGATVVWMAPAEPPDDAVPVVAAANLERVARGTVIASPGPAVIAASTLLAPLVPFGLDEVVGWISDPSSSGGQQGIDELLDQTRSILSFQSDLPTEVFGHQLAFNLLPAPGAGHRAAADVAAALELESAPHLQIVRPGVFHGVAAGVFVRLDQDVAPDEIRESLLASPFIVASDEPDTLGPIDAAGSPTLLLGHVEPAGAGDRTAHWLWAVMDNLALGGTANALAIAEALTGSGG